MKSILLIRKGCCDGNTLLASKLTKLLDIAQCPYTFTKCHQIEAKPIFDKFAITPDKRKGYLVIDGELFFEADKLKDDNYLNNLVNELVKVNIVEQKIEKQAEFIKNIEVK